MNRPQQVATKPQLALQSYLDGLLQEATEVLESPAPIAVARVIETPVPTPVVVEAPAVLDEFQAAVLEEQARDARLKAPAPVFAEPPRLVMPVTAPPLIAEVVEAVEVAEAVVEVAPVVAQVPAPVEPLVEVYLPAGTDHPVPPLTGDGRPAWAAEPFECLLFDVAGLTLAVPLVCLGSIYSLAGQELTPLFGQPDWFLGILRSQAGNLKVLDTARWVMPDRYRDDFRQGLQYVISVQGYEWGLAVHQVSRSLRLDPSEIKWRTQRGQRPWLAGTVIEHMCALLDVAELAELIASGAVKQLHSTHK